MSHLDHRWDDLLRPPDETDDRNPMLSQHVRSSASTRYVQFLMTIRQLDQSHPIRPSISAIVTASKPGTTPWPHSRFLTGQAGADPHPERRACCTPVCGIGDPSKHAASDPESSCAVG